MHLTDMQIDLCHGKNRRLLHTVGFGNYVVILIGRNFILLNGIDALIFLCYVLIVQPRFIQCLISVACVCACLQKVNFLFLCSKCCK